MKDFKENIYTLQNLRRRSKETIFIEKYKEIKERIKE